MKVLKEPLNDSGRFMFNKIYRNVSGFLVVPVLLFSLTFADIMITYMCDFKVKLLPCLLSKGSIN